MYICPVVDGIFKRKFWLSFALVTPCFSLCRCCDKETCEVAFMIDGNCYGVRCYDQERCRIRKAKSTALNPMLSFITREGMSKCFLRFANHSIDYALTAAQCIFSIEFQS